MAGSRRVVNCVTAAHLAGPDHGPRPAAHDGTTITTITTSPARRSRNQRLRGGRSRPGASRRTITTITTITRAHGSLASWSSWPLWASWLPLVYVAVSSACKLGNALCQKTHLGRLSVSRRRRDYRRVTYARGCALVRPAGVEDYVGSAEGLSWRSNSRISRRGRRDGPCSSGPRLSPPAAHARDRAGPHGARGAGWRRRRWPSAGAPRRPA